MSSPDHRHPSPPHLPRPPELSVARRRRRARPRRALRALRGGGAALRRHRRAAHGGRRRRARHRGRDPQHPGSRHRGRRAPRGAISACRPESPTFPPSSSGRSPTRSSRASVACCTSSPTRSSERPLFRENLRRLCRDRPSVRSLRPARPARQGDRARRRLPGRALRPRPLRRASITPRRAALARADRRDRPAPQRRGQDLGRRRLRRPEDLDRSTTSAPLSSM